MEIDPYKPAEKFSNSLILGVLCFGKVCPVQADGCGLSWEWCKTIMAGNTSTDKCCAEKLCNTHCSLKGENMF